MRFYRAALLRKGSSTWRPTYVMCHGRDEFVAALHAEQMVPEHRCIALEHRMVGVMAKDESTAGHFVQSVIEHCSRRAELGHWSVGPINFRVLTGEQGSADTWFDEIHLINPTLSWQKRWRGLSKRGQLINAHYFDLSSHHHTPAYRNYCWDDLTALTGFWSEWYEKESTEELFTLHSGEFSNAGPVAAVGLALHLRASSPSRLLQQLIECGAGTNNNHPSAVWATLKIPATAKLVDVVQIQHQLTQLFLVEPEINLGICSAHSAFQIALVAWLPGERF